MYTDFCYVIEIINEITGDLRHEASQVPVNYSDPELTMTDLGIRAYDHGILRPLTKGNYDLKALEAFKIESNRLVQADRQADQRMAA